MSKDDILEIKSRLDIVQVITPYVQLKKAGRTWMGLCPFHNERTPSFHVNPQLGFYKCFGCGKHGDIFTFIQDVEHVEFSEALERLADMAGVKLSTSKDSQNEQKIKRMRELLTVASEFYHYILQKHPSGEIAREYSTKRGLKPETIEKYKIGYAPQKYTTLQDYLLKKGFTKAEITEAGLTNERGSDKFTDRLMFTLFDNSGHVVGFSGRVIRKDDIRPKYLNSPETLVFKKRFLLFGFYQAKDAIAKQDAAIICEGQLDAISSQQAGVMNIVAPLGTGLTDTQLQLISRLTPNVVFAFDNDVAGQKSTKRGVELALSLNLKPYIVQLPTDVKDIDELVQKDSQKWVETIENKKDYFAVVFAELGKLMKNDFSQFEAVLAETLETISHATPLKKALLLKECAQVLGLDEKVLAETISPKQQQSLFTEKIRENERSRSVAEFILQLLLSYPFLAHLLGKTSRAIHYFSVPVHKKVYESIAFFVKPYKQVIKDKVSGVDASKSWASIAHEFQTQHGQEWQRAVYSLQQDDETTAFLVSLQDQYSGEDIDLSDEMVKDFVKATTRLRQHYLSTKIANLQKGLISAEANDNEEESDRLQKKLEKYVNSLKKLR